MRKFKAFQFFDFLLFPFSAFVIFFLQLTWRSTGLASSSRIPQKALLRQDIPRVAGGSVAGEIFLGVFLLKFVFKHFYAYFTLR